MLLTDDALREADLGDGNTLRHIEAGNALMSGPLFETVFQPVEFDFDLSPKREPGEALLGLDRPHRVPRLAGCVAVCKVERRTWQWGQETREERYAITILRVVAAVLLQLTAHGSKTGYVDTRLRR